MGIYFDPRNVSKEEWLYFNAEKFIPASALDAQYDLIRSNNQVPICLVDNGSFRAAGIAYTAFEYHRFIESTDDRPVSWWLVSVDKLLEEMPRMRQHLID